MSLRVVMAQLNLHVGALEKNVDAVLDACVRARDELAADVVVFPELTVTGYPPEDLLLRPGFLDAVDTAMARLQDSVQGIDAVIGFPERDGEQVYNSACLLRDGQRLAVYRKHSLPNYSVFDEKRYFQPGFDVCVVDIAGMPVGLTICEDIWESQPAEAAASAGARLLFNLNASPFNLNKFHQRQTALSERARESGLPVVYVNLVGGQDELVFDGESLVVDASGDVVVRAPAFEEGLFVVEIDDQGPQRQAMPPLLEEVEGVYRALVTGVRDYIVKNGFSGAVLGLSGGIDSALTLAIACDAIGADRVKAVMMPSRYSADMSLDDAVAEAEALGAAYEVISIEPTFKAYLASLENLLAGRPPDTTEQNIQARCRGTILMAISNKEGRILLSTGNKSELAVGYSTLYGDMAGGFAPIKDVPKALVYALARYRNSLAPVIPQRVIDRPPSAELAPDQVDEDNLPAYEILDPVLERYVEADRSVEDIIGEGFDADTVHRIARMVDVNEYKRRQAAPGVRVTSRAFGRDRRYPVTSGFRSDSAT